MTATPIEPDPTENPAASTAQAPAPPAATQTTTPPWGEDDANFDAEKAKKLISDLRADKEKLATRSVLTEADKAKLAEYDVLVEASKTELEKAQEAAGKVAPLQSENLRLKVALDKGLTGEKAALIGRLQGETIEELSADADNLLKLFTPPAGPETQAQNPAQNPVQVPRPTPGQGASAAGTPTPAEQAAQAAASGDWRASIRLKSQQLAQTREAGND